MKFRPLLRGPIALRLFLFNCLLVFVPMAGFFSFEAFEKALLKQQENAMVQEGRALAAWLASIPLDRDRARDVIARLGKAHTSRIRIISKEGALLADSSAGQTSAEPRRETETYSRISGSVGSSPAEADRAPQATLLYRLLSAPVRLIRKYALPPSPPLETADWYAKGGRFDGIEILTALKGSYGSTTRVSSGGQTSITLYAALPIEEGGGVAGVVLVSQSTYRILGELYTFRLSIGRIFLYSLLAAIAVSFILGTTISRPLARLGREAKELEERGRSLGDFTGSGRGDEIDELAMAFSSLVRRLDERIGWAERFAADASHELKNPLAGIRANAELLEGGSPQHDRIVRSIQAACGRMEGTINGLRSLSLLDRPSAEVELLPLRESLRALVSRYPGVSLSLEGLDENENFPCEGERFECALGNVIENALSFSPDMGTVSVNAKTAGNILEISVEDRGPGIDADILPRIFDRFFSSRVEGKKDHSGLGLSLVKAVAESSGGSVEALNREGGGARFILRFPRRS